VAIINNILALKVVFLNLITLHCINEVGGSCGTHGRVEKLYTVFVGNPKGKRPLERQSTDGMTGTERILGRLAGSVEWMQLAQDRGRWRALVNMVMNFRILAPRS
jgi:hypothetical protein